MLGPELATAHGTMNGLLDVRTDPNWAYSPVEETAFDQYLFLAEADRLPCDVCSRRVNAEDGFLVSPTELRSDPDSLRAAGQVYAATVKGLSAEEREAEGAARAALDWSHWVVCDVCVDRLRPQRKATKAKAASLAARAAEFRASPGLATAGLLASGLAMQKEGRYAEAIDLYQRVLDTGDPLTAPEAAFSIGVLRASLGDLRLAEAAYLEAIDPRWPHPVEEAAFNLGNMRRDRGDLAGAAWAYGLAASGTGDKVKAQAYLQRGFCLVKLQQELGQALESFTSAIRAARDPADEQGAWLGFGMLYAQEDRRSEALAAWEKAVAGPSHQITAFAAATATRFAIEWGDHEAGLRFFEILYTHGNADIADKVLGPIADYLEEYPNAANTDGP
jgi:tetratricopeptide (TPR) repeat protein